MILSCKDKSQTNNSRSKDSLNKTNDDTAVTNSFIYKLEQERLIDKRKLTKELNLYDIENGAENFEIRVWKMRSLFNPSILYILKLSDSIWTLRHYQYYFRSENFDNSPPIIDSILMETLKPQKMTWTNYIKQLNLDSLWDLKTESEIKDKSFEVLDGWIWLMEINNKKAYKYFHFTVPELYKDRDINHKKFADFLNRLIDPIIYKGMRNP